MSNSTKDTLMTLLTQPFSQLHRSLGSNIPPHAPPSYSCRSGLSALLAAVGPQGPEAVPFSMSIRKRHQGPDHGDMHITTFEPRTLSQVRASPSLTCAEMLAVDQCAFCFGSGLPLS
jgi:hypothetical protein